MPGSSGRTPVIRRYRGEDFDRCCALWAELTIWHRELYDDPALGGADPGASFGPFLEEAGEDGVWVAIVDGEVAGFAGLLPRGRGRAELEPIVVGERFRGQGVGRRLARAVIAAARERGIGRVSVRPAARNAQAIRFFHAVGFDLLGRLELQVELRPERVQRREGELIAGRTFRF